MNSMWGMTTGWAPIEREVFRTMDLPYAARAVYGEICAIVNICDRQALFGGMPTVIKTGQSLLSITKLAKSLHMNRKTLYRALALLQRLGVIERISNGSGTIITLIKNAADRFKKRMRNLGANLKCDTPRGQPPATQIQPPAKQGYKREEFEKIKEDTAPNEKTRAFINQFMFNFGIRTGEN